MSGINEIVDLMDPTYRGFICALRSREYFDFFQAIYERMDTISAEFLNEKGTSRKGVYLETQFKTPAFARIWTAITTLYDKGLAPIAPRQDASQNEDVYLNKIKGDIVGALRVLHPNTNDIDADVLSFFENANERFLCDIKTDFLLARGSLQTNALYVADQYTMVDLALKRTDSSKAIDRRYERCSQLRSLFSVSSGHILLGGSFVALEQVMADVLEPRLKTHSGVGDLSFDDPKMGVGGLHAKGLAMIISGTGGNKTLVKSSIAANLIYNNFKQQVEAPTIWGFIGEDSPSSYMIRIMLNIMNRPEGRAKLGRVTFSDFQEKLIRKDPVIMEFIKYINNEMLKNTLWLRAPSDVKSKLNYSIVDILANFDATLESTGSKPDLIILDYFNLLLLPRTEREGIQARDLARIANIVDDWSEQRGISVLSSIQANSTGNTASRDNLRLLELEDMSESKAVSNSCRLVMSLMPHISKYSPTGDAIEHTLAMKILKNRNGQKHQIFMSPLDEGCNLGFAETKRVSRSEWAEHKLKVIEQLSAFNEQSGAAEFQKPKKGGYQSSSQNKSNPFTANKPNAPA
ncbi:MAG: hypothetical protein EOP06_04195, partial [Proteobacteria bacterium]